MSQPMTIRVPDETIKALRLACQKEGVSINSKVIELIQQWLRTKKVVPLSAAHPKKE